jgi:hypothetical protein
MKLLKISFAVLLFSFVGSMQNQVLAQTNNLGKWTRSMTEDDYLENGDFRARVQIEGGALNLIIYRSDNGDAVRSGGLYSVDHFTKLKDFCLIPDNNKLSPGNTVCFTDTNGGVHYKSKLHKNDRYRDFEESGIGKVLNSDVESGRTAYFQLEDDGRFVIYNTSGVLGTSSGTAIVELIPKKN